MARFWRRSEEAEEAAAAVEGEESDYVAYERQLAEQEREARAEFIESKRNKSKLTASHRYCHRATSPPVPGRCYAVRSLTRATSSSTRRSRGRRSTNEGC
jgi:hypothetical protein